MQIQIVNSNGLLIAMSRFLIAMEKKVLKLYKLGCWQNSFGCSIAKHNTTANIV